jgi:hypothetical protein
MPGRGETDLVEPLFGHFVEKSGVALFILHGVHSNDIVI